MRRVLGLIALAAVLQIIGAQPGYSARILNATETTGRLGGDITSATDSGLPPPGNVCTPANENATACFGTAYDVPSALINPAFVANGGALGVNLCDSFANCDTTNGRDPTNTISDQLYLQVGAQNVAAGTNSVLWCWDSDLEPNVNICQDQIALSSNQLSTVLEPLAPGEGGEGGTVDLTRFFTDPGVGPLAAGQWQVFATSETPEPASLSILAASLLGMGAYRRLRRR
jgi:hypothetical protein